MNACLEQSARVKMEFAMNSRIFLIVFCFAVFTGKAIAWQVQDNNQQITESSNNNTSIPQAGLSIALKEPKENKPEVVTIAPMVKRYVGLTNKGRVTDLAQAKELSAKLVSLSDGFNPAEQFLFYSVRATIAYQEQRYQISGQLFKRALEYQDQIAEQQLARPEFYYFYRTWANAAIELLDFKRAYLAEDKYYQYFKIDSKQAQKSKIAALDEKYQMTIKQKQNQLLDDATELEALKIESLRQEQDARHYKTVILVVGLIVFVLLIIRQLRLRRKLAVLEKTDSLTGLFNRSALFDYGERALQKHREQSNPLSCLLFDLDNFKQINDDYGHDAGDLVLRTVSDLANEVMRTRDLLARIGGEEFIAVLPVIGIEQAKAIAERLREKIAEHDYQFQGQKLSVKASFGVAELAQIEQNQEQASFDSLVSAADASMYRAKQLGGNKVCCFSDLMSSGTDSLPNREHVLANRR